MTNVGGLASFTANLANGYMQGKERERERQRQDKQDAYQESQQAFQAEQQAVLRKQQERENALQTGLSNAAAPATMTPVEGSVLPPDQAGPSLALYRVKGNGIDETTSDQAAASKSAAAYNAPESVATRQAGVYRANAMPDKAMSLESAVVSRGRETEKYEADEAERARKLQQEGVFDAVRAFRSGDASGIVKAFNAGGDFKLEGEPVLTKENREVPGIGTIPSYTAKMRIVGPDGKVEEKTYNSHDLSMQIMPYEKTLELQRKGSDSETMATYKAGLLDSKQGLLDQKIKELELRGQLAEAKALKAAANGGAIGREERLRYTSLFSDAGRRMSEAQQALSKLQGDTSFMRKAAKPGSEESQQVARLNDSLATYAEERKLYQGLLVGSQSGASLADARKPTAPPANIPAMPKTKAELKTGTVYNTARGPAKWNGSVFEAQ